MMYLLELCVICVNRAYLNLIELPVLNKKSPFSTHEHYKIMFCSLTLPCIVSYPLPLPYNILHTHTLAFLYMPTNFT